MSKLERGLIPYCDTEEDLFELINVAVNEINKGATELWVYGSRARGGHSINSDFDLLVINPYAAVKPGVEYWIAQLKGSERNLNKMPPLAVGQIIAPWIDVRRFTQERLEERLEEHIEWIVSMCSERKMIWRG